MAELAKAQVSLEVDFEHLDDDVKKGLEQRVRKAAKIAQAELDDTTLAAAALGDTITKRVGGGADKAADRVRRAARSAQADLDKTRGAAASAADAVEGIADALFDIEPDGVVKLRHAVEDVQTALFDLDTVEIDRVQESSERASRSLRERLVGGAHAARDALFGVDDSRGVFARVGSAATGAASAVGGGFVRASETAVNSFSRIGVSGPVAVGLVVAALALIPVAAAAAAGAVTFGLGSVLAGLGLVAASGSDRAKAAIADLKAFVVAESREIAEPFEETWEDIVSSAKVAFRELEPTLSAAADDLAPALSDFAADAAESLGGLDSAILGTEDAFSAVLEDLGPRLPEFFATVAEAVTTLTDAIKEDPAIVGEFAQGFANLLKFSSQVINFLTDVYGLFANLEPLITALTVVISPLTAVLGHVFVAGETAQPAIDGTAQSLTGLGGAAGFAIPLANGMAVSLEGAAGAAGATGAEAGGAATSVGALGVASASAAAAADTQRSAQELLTAALADGNTSEKQLKAAIEATTGAAQSAFDATTRLAEAQAAANEAIKKNGATLDANTAKGRANRDALLGVAQAAQEKIAALHADDASTERIIEVSARARRRFIELATSMGASRDRARELADELLGIPKHVRAKVSAETAQAEGALQRVLNLIGAVRRNPSVGVLATGAAGGLVQKLAAGGLSGLVRGPGTSTSDSIPTLLSDNEFVVNAKQTKRHLGLLRLINAGRLASGGLVGAARMAAGGLAGARRLAAGGLARGRGVDIGALLGDDIAAGLRGSRKKITAEVKKIAETLAGNLRQVAKDVGHDFRAELVVGSADQIDAAFERLNDQISRAFEGIHSRVDNRLIARLEVLNSRLQRIAVRRDEILAAIEQAQQFARSVTDDARRFAGLAGLGEEQTGSARAVATGLRERLAAIRQFAADIANLGKRGLDQGLIQQLVEGGPDQAGSLARTLATSTTLALREVSTVQRAIDKATAQLGRNTADLLFDAGREAGRGFLAGLNAERDEIVTLMEEIAKSVASTVKRTLKIRSPSVVLERDGVDTLAGYIKGLRRMAGQVRSTLRAAVTPDATVTRAAALPRARDAAAPTGTAAAQSGAGVVKNVTLNNTFNQVLADAQSIIDVVEGRLVAAIR